MWKKLRHTLHSTLGAAPPDSDDESSYNFDPQLNTCGKAESTHRRYHIHHRQFHTSSCCSRRVSFTMKYNFTTANEGGGNVRPEAVEMRDLCIDEGSDRLTT